MIEHKPQPDANETPEDVATLYSWANLHGAKYRDFSSSRAVAREESRVRVEASQEAERQRLADEAERIRQEEVQLAARKVAEEAERVRQEEAERLAEIARQAEAERQAVLAAQEAQRQAALQRTWEPPPPEAYLGGYEGGKIPLDEMKQASFVHSFPQAPEADLPEFEPAAPRFEELSERFHPAQPQAPGKFYSEANPDNYIPLAQSSAHPQFPIPGLSAAPESSPYRAPRQSSERHQEPPAQPRTHSAPQASQSGFGERSGLPVESAAPQPVQMTYSQPVPEVRSVQRYPAPPQNPMAYEPNVDFPSPDFAEPDYGQNAQEQSGAFRPAWLAPLPPPLPPASQQTASQQPRYTPTQAPIQPQRFNSQPVEAYQAPTQIYTTNYSPDYSQPTQEFPPNASSQQSAPRPSSSNPNEGYPQDSREPTAHEHVSSEPAPNRWYALKSVFDPQAASEQSIPQPPAQRAPVLAIFSLAGGVGKTSLVASLGRALSARGERVMLIDTAAYGLLPFFFGARDQRPGQLRTFNPPGVSVEAPIQLVTLDPEGQAPESQPNASPEAGQDWLAQEVSRYARGGVNRVLIDLPTASGSTTRRVMRLAPTVLVPVLPDMNSVVSVGAIEAFFRHNGNVNGKQIMPYYVLNQFDYTLPLHLDVRQILKDQLGDRLLGFAIRRSTVVSEALAEGMTVTDYAPSATVAEDYANLAGWVRSLAAPAAQMNRGVRWSER